jgi:tripartite-type tricarboxylate transporter receptor subunit TctC
VVNPHLQRGDRIDLVEALIPIAQLATYQYVMVVPSKLGVTTLLKFVKLAKSRAQGSLTYASSGIGSNNHLAALLFSEVVGGKLRAGVATEIREESAFSKRKAQELTINLDLG